MSLTVTRVLCRAIAWLIICYAVNTDQFQCKDESNSPVDWYVLYKLPKSSMSSRNLIKQGSAYLFVTSATVGTGWQLSTESIGSNTSIPGLTLAPLYDRRNEGNSMWTMYNDQPPDASSNGNHGHTKGLVIANSQQGFWLIHSVPGYPPVPYGGELKRPSSRGRVSIQGRYAYPETGTKFGQSFLCVSLGSDQFNTVGKQLIYNEIMVYLKNIPDVLGDQYPMLKNATNERRVQTAPYRNQETITSKGSVQFTSFAKSKEWGQDLYAEFVAPKLNVDLVVQSWQRPGKLPSNPTGKKVCNVKSLKFEMVNLDDVKGTCDHSKWAITDPLLKKAAKWVCVGDINRASTQAARGGGALCIKNPQLWADYRTVLNEWERC